MLNLGALRLRVEKGLFSVRRPALRRALRHKVLPAIEHLPVLQALPEVGLVLDVGANVGQFALAARERWPNARIISFEPLPECASTIRAVFDGDPRTEVRVVAISDHAGEAEFHVTGRADSSSLLRVGRRQVEEFATDEARVVHVQVARLDDALGPDDLPPEGAGILLKVDTQGTELAVLQGAEQLLQRATHVLAEVSFVELYEGQADAGEVTRFLTERGFDLVSVYDVKTSRHTGEPLQADAVYARRR